MIRMIGFFILWVAVSACSKSFVANQLSDVVVQSASCSGVSGKITDLLAESLIQQQDLPTISQIERSLESVKAPKVRKAALELYKILLQDVPQDLGANTKAALLEALVGLEIGDQTTTEKQKLQSKLKSAYNNLNALAKEAGQACLTGTPSPTPGPGSGPGALQVSQNPAALGASKVLATAYQSCEAHRAPAMVSSSPQLQGISIVGKSPNGVGNLRVVSDLGLVQKTHYYIREGVESTSCFDVTKNPLIYDYGGKPYATTAETSSLNLFRDAGNGTSVLGIDCSGYVFSALAVSGLHVTSGKKMKASLVYGINAAMYMDPQNNGLTCLNPVVTQPGLEIQDGDILASSGHVVMIDRVGSDPFGLSAISKSSDCTTANISSKRFDFDILQSSPTHGGIGIDRSRASDYLSESSGMQSALVEYAVAACKAKFGATLTVKPSSARLVRHKLTADCRDTPVPIEGSSCVQSCL